MKLSASVVLIIAVVYGILAWWLRGYHHTSGAVLIALGAFAVSCFAQFQASRSAHNSSKTTALAQLNEERASS
jgi:membrane protein YdbS with pleckstrin-like domain